MRQLHRQLAISFVMAITLGLPQLASAAEHSVDTGHSSVSFNCFHKVAPFYGLFRKMEGSITYDAAKIEATRIAITIDASSIFTSNKKRDDHLKGPDFLNVAQFPSIRFESTKVSAGKSADTLNVTGKMTVRGVTKPMSLTVKKTGEGKTRSGKVVLGFHAEFSFKRSDFGMTYLLGPIGDTIDVRMGVEAIRQ